MRHRFCRRPLVVTPSGIAPLNLDREVRGTLGLWCAGLDHALAFGSELSRTALGACPLKNDRKHVLVDVKVHMLKPGMCPAIMGWHTDGTPRGGSLSAQAKGAPDLALQEENNDRAPRFHLFVTGQGCLTEFVREPADLLVADRSTTLFADLTSQVNRCPSLPRAPVSSCVWTTFDWWDIHQGVVATESEWRLLIRVTETDFDAPERDLNKVLRTQQNVYLPREYGW